MWGLAQSPCKDAYYGIIYPHMKYEITIWGCAPKLYKKIINLSRISNANSRKFKNQIIHMI